MNLLCPALGCEMDACMAFQGRRASWVHMNILLPPCPKPTGQDVVRTEALWSSVNTMSPDRSKETIWHSTSPEKPGWNPGAAQSVVALTARQRAARRLPQNTNYMKENKCLQPLKQVPSGAETLLQRTALILGWCPPSPQAIILTVGNNQLQQRKQQNLHNQWSQPLSQL